MNAITQELANAIAGEWTRDNPECDALAGIPALTAQLRASFQARLATPQPAVTPLTPAQLQSWDDKSLRAYWGQA